MTSQRLKSAFQSNRKAFTPFLMAGAPDPATSQSFLNRLPEAGADIIELGMPFSDPMADGPIIEAAGKRALENGMNPAGVLNMVREFRKHHQTPIVLMGYYNPVYRYGPERFCADAAAAGVDGLLIVDLPPEEEAELTPFLKTHGLDLIRLITPTTPPERIKRITAHAGGFIYYVSVKGVTGGKSADTGDLQQAVQTIKNITSLPVAAGFGIKTPQQAAEAAKAADAVVVGAALVQKLQEEGLEAALGLAKELAAAIKV